MTSLVEQLVARYGMSAHEEGGSFIDLKNARVAGKRDSSGAIYYHLACGQISDFHVIDCDEYWAYIAGDTLELWMVSPSGELAVHALGVTEGAEPLVYIPTGTIFAARPSNDVTHEGTFLSCITVPRFHYEGWRIVDRIELHALCPAALAFYEDAQ